MSRHLPDVNVLLALLWPQHSSHRASVAWFEKSGRRSWATNPLTELGALRLLTNPAITKGAVSASAAVEALADATNRSGHEFWPLTRSTSACLARWAEHLTGHGQWTDAILLWQASERGGVLVTFDAGLKALAGRLASEHVLLLKQY
jgi:uncharacterized protein